LPTTNPHRYSIGLVNPSIHGHWSKIAKQLLSLWRRMFYW
jgi:hypothetical protein